MIIFPVVSKSYLKMAMPEGIEIPHSTLSFLFLYVQL